MRTTVVIDDAILREAKLAAAKAGCTLSELINQALAATLAQRKQPQQTPFRMVVYGGRATTAHEPEDFQRALDEDDAAALAR
jgi:antitoxin component of RelBE/YafQ-DinJ toxin-antitoxin module